MREYWLPLAFQDCALFHSFIGCADVYVSGYTTIKDNFRGSRHLQAAISIVNQRLVERKYLNSAGSLSVIAGIALLEVRTSIFVLFCISPFYIYKILNNLLPIERCRST